MAIGVNDMRNPNFAPQIADALRGDDGLTESAKSIGGSLVSLEAQLVKAYASYGVASKTDAQGKVVELSETELKQQENQIQTLDLKYKRAMRVYEAFQQIVRNMHEIMQRMISNLSVR